MRMVSRLLSCGIDDTGVVEAVVCEDNPLLNRDGVLERIALAEILAQSFAAKQGYEDLKKGLSAEQGFLVAIREITCYAAARPMTSYNVCYTKLLRTDEIDGLLSDHEPQLCRQRGPDPRHLV